MSAAIWVFEGSHGRAEVMAQLVGQYAAAMQELGAAEESADPFERLAAEMSSDGPEYVLAPRLERLFPPALADDEEAAQFRRAAISQQATDRFAAARRVLEGLAAAEDDDVVVHSEDIDAWVKTLSALRASWHVELTGSADRLAEPSVEDLDENPPVAAVCDWIGFLIEDALESKKLWESGR